MITLIVFLICFAIGYFVSFFIKLRKKMRRQNELYQRERIEKFNHFMAITDMRA